MGDSVMADRRKAFGCINTRRNDVCSLLAVAERRRQYDLDCVPTTLAVRRRLFLCDKLAPMFIFALSSLLQISIVVPPAGTPGLAGWPAMAPPAATATSSREMRSAPSARGAHARGRAVKSYRRCSRSRAPPEIMHCAPSSPSHLRGC